MKLKEIMESSLGAYSEALYDAFKEGYRLSDDPSRYPWVSYQYQAVLECLDEPTTETKPRGRPVKS